MFHSSACPALPFTLERDVRFPSTSPLYVCTASPCRLPAAAATSPGTSHPAAPARAMLAAEPPGNFGFQDGPCPGRKRDWGARRFRRQARPPPRCRPCCSRSLPWGRGRPWTPAWKATSEQSHCWYLKPIRAPARHPICKLVWTLSQGTRNWNEL